MATSRTHPQDYSKVLLPPDQAAPVQRIAIPLGQFTVNSTKTVPALVFDRRAVIREIWFVADAVPSDPDGTMLINVDVRDKSEGAFDSIVANFDTEAELTVAYEGKKAPDTNETAENELTVDAGDGIRVQMVNNSAGITTNPNVTLLLLVQYIGPYPS